MIETAYTFFLLHDWKMFLLLVFLLKVNKIRVDVKTYYVNSKKLKYCHLHLILRVHFYWHQFQLILLEDNDLNYLLYSIKRTVYDIINNCCAVQHYIILYSMNKLYLKIIYNIKSVTVNVPHIFISNCWVTLCIIRLGHAVGQPCIYCVALADGPSLLVTSLPMR